MCLSLVLVVASVSALNLALPDLAVSLNASNTSLTWIADGYTVALAALVLPIGAIGDRVGRRNVLIVGNVVFGLASAAAAAVDDSNHLIICRIAMGVGAAMIMPGTLSTITAAFPTEQRARGVATWSGFAAAGAIIGLLVAGALLERWGWQSLFVVSAITAVLAALAAWALAPNTKDEHGSSFDTWGALFTAVGIGALVYAIIEGNDRGWGEVPVVVAVVACVVGFAAYVVHGLRARHPLLDPRLFRLAGFRTGAITVLTQFMAIFGFFYVGLQFLQLILDYSPLKAAVALMPVALLVIPVSLVTPRIIHAVSLRAVLAGGLTLLAVGMIWISRLDADSGYLGFLGGVLVAGIGIGLTSSAGTDAIVSSLTRDQQGVASAMNDTTREVGSAVGIALMGSVYSSRYADNLPNLTHLPSDAAQVTRDSAAGGLAVAERLGGSTGARLAGGVRDAFIDGLSASLIVIAVILVVAAVGVLFRAPKTLTLADAENDRSE